MVERLQGGRFAWPAEPDDAPVVRSSDLLLLLAGVDLAAPAAAALESTRSRTPRNLQTSIPGSNPGGASIFPWSVPDTWVTVHSGHIGNTFAAKGFSIGSSRQVSSSK